MIDFDNMTELVFESIEFTVMDTSAADPPTITKFNKFLKRPEYDKPAARKQLLSAAGIDFDASCHFIMLVNLSGGTPEIFGFQYLEDRTILALSFLPSQNFNLLLDVNLEPFHGTQPTLLKFSRIVTADENGGGCSGRIFDVDALTSNTPKFLELHAPEEYAETSNE